MRDRNWSRLPRPTDSPSGPSRPVVCTGTLTSPTWDWSNAPFAKWFVGGRLNVAYNCVDRHVEAGNGSRVAIHWVGEPADSRDLTYDQLLTEVS